MFKYINENINYTPKIEDYLKFEDEQKGNSDSSVDSNLDNSLDELKKEKEGGTNSNDDSTSTNSDESSGTSSDNKQDDFSDDPESGSPEATSDSNNGDGGYSSSPESSGSGTSSSTGGSFGSSEQPVEMQFSKQGLKFRRLTMFTELSKIYRSIRETKTALENMKTQSVAIKSCVAQLQELENDTNVILKTFDAYTAEDALIHTQMIKERASIIIEMVKRATRHEENQNLNQEVNK